MRSQAYPQPRLSINAPLTMIFLRVRSRIHPLKGQRDCSVCTSGGRPKGIFTLGSSYLWQGNLWWTRFLTTIQPPPRLDIAVCGLLVTTFAFSLAPEPQRLYYTASARYHTSSLYILLIASLLLKAPITPIRRTLLRLNPRQRADRIPISPAVKATFVSGELLLSPSSRLVMRDPDVYPLPDNVQGNLLSQLRAVDNS